MATKANTLQVRIAQIDKSYAKQIKGFTAALEGFASANDALASISFPDNTPIGDVFDVVTRSISLFRKYGGIGVVENTSKNSEGTLAFDTTHAAYDAARQARSRFMRLFKNTPKPEEKAAQVSVPPEVLALARKMAKLLAGTDGARKIMSTAVSLALKG